MLGVLTKKQNETNKSLLAHFIWDPRPQTSEKTKIQFPKLEEGMLCGWGKKWSGRELEKAKGGPREQRGAGGSRAQAWLFVQAWLCWLSAHGCTLAVSSLPTEQALHRLRY